MGGLGTAKSNSHRETHQVEPDGTGRKAMFLLGETRPGACERAGGESAEAVVTLTPGESRDERRAEVSRKNDSLHWLVRRARRRAKRARRCNCGSSRDGAQTEQVDSRMGEVRALQVMGDREHSRQKMFNEQHG
jgi:hypothetical protein